VAEYGLDAYLERDSVRNNSRDWVIGIGVEMLEDPELAKIIDEPLKAKLYRIDPGVKIFRCKGSDAAGQAVGNPRPGLSTERGGAQRKWHHICRQHAPRGLVPGCARS
jgi:hypothetical protein